MYTELRQGHDLSPSQAQPPSLTGLLHVCISDWEIRLELVVQGPIPALEAALMTLDGQTAKVTVVSVE